MIESMQSMLAMWMPGPFEMAVILIIAVLLFGRRLPEIARGMGKSVTEFKKGISEAKSEVEQAADIENTRKEIQEAGSAVDEDLNRD